jgi:hypothetical protein
MGYANVSKVRFRIEDERGGGERASEESRAED